MKIRTGLISNSSSSSFLLVSLGEAHLIDQGCADECDDCNEVVMDIDIMIAELEAAKASGVKVIKFEYGGGYAG